MRPCDTISIYGREVMQSALEHWGISVKATQGKISVRNFARNMLLQIEPLSNPEKEGRVSLT